MAQARIVKLVKENNYSLRLRGGEPIRNSSICTTYAYGLFNFCARRKKWDGGWPICLKLINLHQANVQIDQNKTKCSIYMHQLIEIEHYSPCKCTNVSLSTYKKYLITKVSSFLGPIGFMLKKVRFSGTKKSTV